LITALFSVSVGSSAAALTITVTDGENRTTAGITGGNFDSVLTPLSSPPFSSGEVTATFAGATATTDITLTDSFLLWEFDLSRVLGTQTIVDDTQPLDFFTDEDVIVTLSGELNVTDTGQGDFVRFQFSLDDVANFPGPMHSTFVERRVN
jgi:hypothetical protein